MLKHFFSHPQTTGAVCASSTYLAQCITSCIKLDQAKAVAEIGPGTGAFTGTILKIIPPDCKFYAVEINSIIAAQLREKFPNLKIYEDSAALLPQFNQKEQIQQLDAIISGLPWALFPDHLQDEILTGIVNSLSDDGYFNTFAYILPSVGAARFRKKLKTYFKKVEKSPIIWANFPPAFVYRCSK